MPPFAGKRLRHYPDGAITEGRTKAIPATANAWLNFVPVDLVADALTKLAAGKDSFFGEFVHICADRSLTFTALLEAISS